MDTIFLPIEWKAIRVWEETDPNLIGEALRHWSFVSRNGQRGCYEIFDLPPFFVPLTQGKDFDRVNKLVYPETDAQLHCYIYRQSKFEEEFLKIDAFKLIVAWKWDGDGCLYFRLDNKKKNIEVINNDCKKDYEWEFVNETSL